MTKTHRLWHQPIKPPQRIGSPVIVDGRVYLLNENGVFQCLTSKPAKICGTSRAWRVSRGPQLVAAAGRLYVPNHDGDTFVLSAGPKFERLAKNSLGEKVLSSIAVSDGELFIRTYKHLWCIGKK